MIRSVLAFVAYSVAGLALAVGFNRRVQAEPPGVLPNGQRTLPERAGDPREGALAARAALDHRLAEVNWEGVKLSDAVDSLRDLSGANLFVNWRALEKVHVTRETPVTVRLKDVPLAKALDTLLAAAAGQRRVLAWTADDGVLVVSTVSDLQKNTLTRTYDVRFAIGHRNGGASTQPAERAARERRAAILVKMLTGSVDPPSWRSNGGDVGAVKELSGQLIVTQSEENQRAVENLLEQLKALNDGK